MSTQPEILPFKPEGPQPLMREIPSGAPYPIEALGPLQGAVEAVQGRTLAPIAIPAQSALAVASLAVQGLADVETLGGNRPLSLYMLTIAASGERKSSCDAPLMAALRDYEREQGRTYRREVEQWKNEQALWKGMREGIMGKAKGGRMGKAEADKELAALGEEPAAPASPDRTVTEPTFEGLTRMFATGQPSLGIFSDEGGQFLGGHAMQSENRQKTLAALNDLWMGNPIRRTRQGDGSYTLHGRRLAVHLMVQPGVARSFMADPLAADTGFLPRFLICEPQSTIGTRLQSLVRSQDAAIDLFGERLRDILAMPMPIDCELGGINPRTLRLAPDARAMLVEFADDIEAAQLPGERYSHITGYASKAAEQAARMAGVLAMWSNPQTEVVTLRDMSNAYRLASYYLSEAARLADAAVISAETGKAERLRRWMLEIWEHPDLTVRDVLQNGPNRLRESKMAQAAIAVLEKHGWLESLESGTFIRGHARKEAWRIIPG